MKSFLKKKAHGDSPVNLGEMSEWCDNRKSIPQEKDQPYVVDYYIPLETDSTTFRVFMTTTRLLKIAAKSDSLHNDSVKYLMEVVVLNFHDYQPKVGPLMLPLAEIA